MVGCFVFPEFTGAIVQDLNNGKPSVILIDRFRNYCHSPSSNCYCGHDLPYGREILKFKKETRVYRVDQSVVDHAINDTYIISIAHYILVVEKESVFQRLANDQFCNAKRCILFTGRGYPDIPTRSKWLMTQRIFRVPELQWLGVFPSDFERYSVTKHCLLPLTAEAMLLRCYLQKDVPQWRLELELMLQKLEIEALSVHTLSILSESYIPIGHFCI